MLSALSHLFSALLRLINLRNMVALLILMAITFSTAPVWASADCRKLSERLAFSGENSNWALIRAEGDGASFLLRNADTKALLWLSLCEIDYSSTLNDLKSGDLSPARLVENALKDKEFYQAGGQAKLHVFPGGAFVEQDFAYDDGQVSGFGRYRFAVLETVAITAMIYHLEDEVDPDRDLDFDPVWSLLRLDGARMWSN